MRWMGEKLNKKAGKITCYGCKIEIGEWQWKGWKCSNCNEKISPVFFISLDKISYRSPSPPPSSNSNSSISFSADSLVNFLLFIFLFLFFILLLFFIYFNILFFIYFLFIFYF